MRNCLFDLRRVVHAAAINAGLRSNDAAAYKGALRIKAIALASPVLCSLAGATKHQAEIDGGRC